ncbi:MAG: hypothetical protein RJA70_2600 [Pseudomonadota bacterium]|jgi:hypothetical protein
MLKRSQTIGITDDTSWSFVTESKPCPVCGSLGGCRRHVNADFACCERRASEWKLTTGAWLHRITPVFSRNATATSVLLSGAEPPARLATGSRL